MNHSRIKQGISFIVCSNGYGHLKRVLLVVNEILIIRPTQRIDLFCKEEHIAFAKKESNFESQTSIVFHSDLSTNEISWLKTDSFTLNRYILWKRDIKDNLILRNSSLIISDNHVLPCMIYSNTFLMGSFLWHDATIAETLDIETIREEETAFIKEHHPKIICVADMIMPQIEQQADCIKLPWFTNRYSDRFSNRSHNEILVTGGGTELINASLLKLSDILSLENAEKDFFLDQKLYAACSFRDKSNVHLFSFRKEAFSSLSAVICRPGVGILTDCVTFSIPAIVINDAYNKEINHNAACVNRLGIGKSFDSDGSIPHELATAVSKTINNKDLLTSYIKNLEALETGGARLAAKYILERSDKYTYEGH